MCDTKLAQLEDQLYKGGYRTPHVQTHILQSWAECESSFNGGKVLLVLGSKANGVFLTMPACIDCVYSNK